MLAMNSTYFINQIAGNIFSSKTKYVLPEQYWIGLSSTAPNIDGSGVTEPFGDNNGYARVCLNTLPPPKDGVICNNNAIIFNESTADWGIMTHYVVYDASTSGNLLFYGVLEPSRHIDADIVLLIDVGELVITLQNETK